MAELSRSLKSAGVLDIHPDFLDTPCATTPYPLTPMTDQDKISRLADAAATGVSSSLPSNPEPAVARPPFAIRKTLCSECHASNMPMPFFPRVAFYQEARVLLGDRSKTGKNHKRSRSSRRPPLVSATCCLLVSLCALYVTSPRGEESLVGVARTVIQASSEAGVMVANAASAKLEP